ncbi:MULTISPECIES: UPF0179 family protein [Acidiplasma]|jgi:uncharacterized protein (UPF0179 family)|uniref:UPF0179 protein AOG55_07890 n=2 Tax=Acidiplasma TaxID=507753 RepID=A0A0Q0VU07_9ARCH|nr:MULTISPECIES: UPF0179 family protein [Acidiplasma]KJE49388.1 hypothetical protein TZ01_04905 [Acidiplasma sp. MBA-1]KPV43657.1 hypothetical protein SE19_08950 [Acidiplasma aeolicum]KQB35087.1 hypothetical protein AOG55_07890 [Acidiplasma cupricumulans]WMT54663.1 MAG: UPF0179 family protein [Acidiplasma sp.]
MGKITLIGVDLARKGDVFTFVGPLTGKCDECRIRNVCFNLEEGKRYKIVNVKEQINPCFIFNKNKVSTVEVEEMPNTFNVQYSRHLIDGISLELKSMKCDYITCPFIEKCNLINYKGSKKIVVRKVLGKIKCPKGYDMREVEY